MANYNPFKLLLGCFLVEKMRCRRTFHGCRQASVMHELWPWLWLNDLKRSYYCTHCDSMELEQIGKNLILVGESLRWYTTLFTTVFLGCLCSTFMEHEPTRILWHETFRRFFSSKQSTRSWWLQTIQREWHFLGATENGGHENLGSQSDNFSGKCWTCHPAE